MLLYVPLARLLEMAMERERERERERCNYMYIRSLFCCNAQEFASRLADAVLRWCAAEQQQRALLLQSLLCR